MLITTPGDYYQDMYVWMQNFLQFKTLSQLMVINVDLRNSKIKITGLEKFSPRKYETQHVRRQVDSLNSILDPQYLKL